MNECRLQQAFPGTFCTSRRRFRKSSEQRTSVTAAACSEIIKTINRVEKSRRRYIIIIFSRGRPGVTHVLLL